MASRDELYTKFGITAEAAQLLETELSTLLLMVNALEKGWHLSPDPEQAQKIFDQIELHTLGRLLKILKDKIIFDEDCIHIFSSGLNARNRLIHGFYERHNFKIQTDEGRDLMMHDLEALHDELFTAWQAASVMTDIMEKLLKSADPNNQKS